jgi:hypothetical protein
MGSSLESVMANRKPDPAQPDSNEQSGSTGRRTEKKDLGRDKDAGQETYGQTGGGGTGKDDTAGQQRYQQRPTGSEHKSESNRGSGNAGDESEKRHGNQGLEQGRTIKITQTKP